MLHGVRHVILQRKLKAFKIIFLGTPVYSNYKILLELIEVL